MSDRDAPAQTSGPGEAVDAPAGSTDPGSPEPASPAVEVPHAGARYAVLRLSLAVTTGGVLYLVGMRGWALLFLAVLISGVLSFFVFLRQREAAARNLEAMVEARRAKHDHSDADDEVSVDSAPAEPGDRPEQ
jgi:hypothetical protein